MTVRLLAAFVALIGLGVPAQAIESGQTLADTIEAPWFGDYSKMKADKVVRALIPYSTTSFYLDAGKEKGISAEYMREFETYLNKGIKKELDKVRVILIPTRRDRLIPALLEGRGDLAVANLTITPERAEQIDFSVPLLRNVSEVVVTAAGAPDIAELKDLAGLEIHVRPTSSYFASLTAVNAELADKGLDPVTIVAADEKLEDESFLEMVNTGIIPATVVDNYTADLWLKLYDQASQHPGFPVRSGGDIAWAFRKDSPEFAKVVNGFLATANAGTLLGNILQKRYFTNVNVMINPKTEAYWKKLQALKALFVKYGEKYDIDPLLLAAQAFQESRFNNAVRSRAGAVGIMQMLPSTARDPNVAIKDITSLEANIEAGAKYFRYMADQYFDGADIPELDRILFVFAGYNAGPNRVARVRKKARDPNVWFDSVDWEVARAAGAEPIRYVKNIYIYYLVFKNFVENAPPKVGGEAEAVVE